MRTVALAVKQVIASAVAGPVLIFDDATGHAVDIDIRGADEEVVGRITAEAGPGRPGRSYSPASDSIADAGVGTPRGRGRPKLGVIAREVTLLPRHWEWLAAQPGGASVALRKLVEEARRTHAQTDRRRRALESAYHFMSAMAGDMPGFEEAARALFAADERRLRKWIAPWPEDVRNHAVALAFGGPP